MKIKFLEWNLTKHSWYSKTLYDHYPLMCYNTNSTDIHCYGECMKWFVFRDILQRATFFKVCITMNTPVWLLEMEWLSAFKSSTMKIFILVWYCLWTPWVGSKFGLQVLISMTWKSFQTSRIASRLHCIAFFEKSVITTNNTVYVHADILVIIRQFDESENANSHTIHVSNSKTSLSIFFPKIGVQF